MPWCPPLPVYPDPVVFVQSDVAGIESHTASADHGEKNVG